ncbi:DUF5703 family protein [Williamsia sterculiae]|uniref:Dihydroorotate dehydrogenase n=1 Tax=Williamsia sterculiae TaxID=1344003 RepID=A0A1N7ELM2_9NOCA|nr:DUF5703 family protein [Williamsia sterculiae]SIR88977.1 hypothetical protein SAMN05445060_1443 [Williamsia sterculiae]
MRKTARGGTTRGFPREWDTITADGYEFLPLRLPPDVTRLTASIRLSIEAEFSGWEISRVRLYSDGTRKVLLKRRIPRRGDTELSA